MKSCPECHSVYYSCEKSPCKNGGRCTLLRELIGDNNAEGFIHTNQGTNDDDDETICSCPDNWSGQFCTEPVIDCISENEKYRLSTTRLTSRFCLNGGVCIIHPGNSSPRCSCPPEWDGYFCELNKSWSAGRIFGIAFSIIFVIFLILVIGFFVWLCYMSRHPNIPQHPAITYLSNYPYNSTISDNDSHKSTRVYMKHEKIFDIPKSNHSPVKLSTFGDNSNPRMDTQKMENIYELPYTTNKTKQNDVNFNSLDRNGSPFTTIQSINENIYINYDTLMSKELQNDLSNI
ncbi:putative pro-neuregulin-4, membrane-bound isoform (Pro-NRG4) [Contains: Neuregulin-4 (NRG-4)] [Schistosoma mansoni]|uniref:putative pro-neuregulin-4, membrane-bound isoform (Pro-NRG4) [Contains: Neuregulin-4 (NRG-4)] n=1 Tax=Schistosoma mansoni TaxID=6183 RepID=UPI00022DC014|nr:putative pro-neuregulin-4, membrane-bound isoform (Pro-NRG4) [Contains: Neuregulin-4 (NRG-4)] [Schistosoma mansoni]|eukprot:XP_018650472.1 putative pro-neuregulin-4, membrane-bound isoform (Pro-NRG4) [Contains: Neuregulin-4 (NRG-4)] [Schistosoma mansoni]